MGPTYNPVSTNKGRPESLNCWRGENPLPFLSYSPFSFLFNLMNPIITNVNKISICSNMNKRPLFTDASFNLENQDENENNTDSENETSKDNNKEKGKSKAT